jgi:hypothetical protein
MQQCAELCQCCACNTQDSFIIPRCPVGGKHCVVYGWRQLKPLSIAHEAVSDCRPLCQLLEFNRRKH